MSKEQIEDEDDSNLEKISKKIKTNSDPNSVREEDSNTGLLLKGENSHQSWSLLSDGEKSKNMNNIEK